MYRLALLSDFLSNCTDKRVMRLSDYIDVPVIFSSLFTLMYVRFDLLIKLIHTSLD